MTRAGLTRRAARTWLLVVLALAFALFAPSLGNRFAVDDRIAAMAQRDDGTPNVMVRELHWPWRYFATNYWHGFRDQDVLYRPVTVWSYAVLYALAGRHLAGEAGEAPPQHAANLLLHVLAVWLAYLLARRLRVPRFAALLGASVFAAHAIHSEVVAGVVGRAELLAFDFGAAATLAFLHAQRPGRTRWLAVGALGLFLAFASKESAVAWAPFLFLCAFARQVQARPDARLGALLQAPVGRWLAAAVPPLAAFLALRAAMIARLGIDAAAWSVELEAMSAGSRIGNALVQWAYGLGATVLPVHLSADWGPAVFAPQPSAGSSPALLAALLLAAALAAGVLGWRRRPLVLVAAGAWFGHGFLTSNLPFRIGTDYAERLYYAPSLGLALLVAWLAQRCTAPVLRPSAAVGLVLWLGWNAVLVLERNPVWRDNDTLLAREVAGQPRSVRMRLQWAAQLEKQGRLEAVQPHLEQVVALMPGHAAAWNHLGTVHARLGRPADALRCFERSLAARGFTRPERAAAAINLALAHALAERAEPALAALDQAAAADPRAVADRVPELRKNLTQRLPYPAFDAWLARLEAAAPAALSWPSERAWLAYDRVQFAPARDHARRALAAPLPQPGRAEMQIVLAVALASTGDKAGAAQLAQQMLADVGTPPHLAQNARDLLGRLK